MKLTIGSVLNIFPLFGCLLATALATVLSSPCWAKVRVEETQPVIFPEGMFELTRHQYISSDDVAQVIPMDMAPTNEASTVAIKIADRSVQLWANTIGKNSVLVQTARSVEKQMQTGVDLKTGANENAINHHIQFNFKAFETLAEVEYLGWTKALFNYNIRQQKSTMKLSEKVLNDKEFTLIQEHNVVESIASVGIGWKW